MKILGIILLVIGILSLFGGLISPSGADTTVVVFGYILKFALIIGGVALISRNSNKKENK
jgi:hypothetical protein